MNPLSKHMIHNCFTSRSDLPEPQEGKTSNPYSDHNVEIQPALKMTYLKLHFLYFSRKIFHKRIMLPSVYTNFSLFIKITFGYTLERFFEGKKIEEEFQV